MIDYKKVEFEVDYENIDLARELWRRFAHDPNRETMNEISFIGALSAYGNYIKKVTK